MEGRSRSKYIISGHIGGFAADASDSLGEMERELGISYPTVRSRVEALVRARTAIEPEIGIAGSSEIRVSPISTVTEVLGLSVSPPRSTVTLELPPLGPAGPPGPVGSAYAGAGRQASQPRTTTPLTSMPRRSRLTRLAGSLRPAPDARC